AVRRAAGGDVRRVPRVPVVLGDHVTAFPDVMSVRSAGYFLHSPVLVIVAITGSRSAVHAHQAVLRVVLILSILTLFNLGSSATAQARSMSAQCRIDRHAERMRL